MTNDARASRHQRFWSNFSEDMKRASNHGARGVWRKLAGDLEIFPQEPDRGLVLSDPQLLPASTACMKGHTRSVIGVLVLPDGLGLLSWSSDNTLRTWGMDGKGTECWICPTGPITDVMLLGDERIVALSDKHVHVLHR